MATRLSALRPLLPAVVAAALLAALAGLLLPTPALAGGSCFAPSTDGSGTTVVMHNLCFTPTVLRVEPGQTITFVNRDDVQHPVMGAGGQWGLDEAASVAGGRGAIRFTRPGLYPYFCHIHVGMIGVIVVGDSARAGLGQPDQVSAAPALASATAAQAAQSPQPAQPAQGAKASAWSTGLALAIAVAIGAAGAVGAGAVLRRGRHDGATGPR